MVVGAVAGVGAGTEDDDLVALAVPLPFSCTNVVVEDPLWPLACVAGDSSSGGAVVDGGAVIETSASVVVPGGGVIDDGGDLRGSDGFIMVKMRKKRVVVWLVDDEIQIFRVGWCGIVDRLMNDDEGASWPQPMIGWRLCFLSDAFLRACCVHREIQAYLFSFGGLGGNPVASHHACRQIYMI